MNHICVYGTVFNSVNTVKKSISSVFNSSYDIIVVDNYSSDGTWEKLQELKKEYNLLLFRLRSSRGKGRAYALKHCPDNSLTVFFDLDSNYNENFHKILRTEINGIDVGTLIIRKEDIIRKGNWRDLNAGEDYELKVRVGFKYKLPVIVSLDQKVKGVREARYVKNRTALLFRLLKKYIDSTRALNYSLKDLLTLYKGKYKLLSVLLYPIPLLLGKYSYEKGVNNWVLYSYRATYSLTNPKDLGLQISDDYISIGYPIPFMIFKNRKYFVSLDEFEKILKERLGEMKKFSYRDYIIYAKNEDAFKHTLEAYYV